MRYYELTCLGEPSLLQEKVISLIKEEKGILADVYKKANTATFYFQIEPENLAELEKKIKAESQISRFIILAKKHGKPQEAPSRTHWVEKPKRKVEIGEIEQKLEEILGQ